MYCYIRLIILLHNRIQVISWYKFIYGRYILFNKIL